jgi:hypothetical protein
MRDFGMRRRLPHESEYLLLELASWIQWRHAQSRESLVLTSAPTSLPSVLERWMPGAVWRLAWLGTGAAILYGLAPTSTPRRYFVVQHDALNARREGLFEAIGDGDWNRIEGDTLEPDANSLARSDATIYGRRPSRRRTLLTRHRARAVNEDIAES